MSDEQTTGAGGFLKLVQEAKPNLKADCDAGGPCSCYRMGFSWLWESINGKGSWESNPWVWVVTFKQVFNESSSPTAEPGGKDGQ